MKYSNVNILDSQQQQCILEILFFYYTIGFPKQRVVGCTVSIFGKYENTHYGSEAICSLQDQFVKSVGRKIALTRAIKTLSRRERVEIWKAYWSNHKKL